MLFLVMYSNDSYGIVKKNDLDILIKSNKVAEFKRDSGRVKIGVDSIRKTKRDHTTKKDYQLQHDLSRVLDSPVGDDSGG